MLRPSGPAVGGGTGAQIGAARAAEISSAFGIGRSSLWRWVAEERSQGLRGMPPSKRGPKGPFKVTAEFAARIHRLAEADGSPRVIGTATGVSPNTVRRALGRGPTAWLPPTPGRASTELMVVESPGLLT